MSVKTVIRFADQLAVEPFFADARFISRNQKHRLALRIEGKGHSPLAIACGEPQLLHVGVAGTVQRIDAGPPQLRAELPEKARQRQNLRLHVFLKREELRLEFVTDLNDPTHRLQYDTHYI